MSRTRDRKASAPAGAPGGAHGLLFFGFDLSDLSVSQQFLLLSLGSIGTSLLFALLQESVFHVKGFHFPVFMTAVTQLTMALWAAVELVLTDQTKRHGRIRDYVLLSVLTFAGMFFTNWSLEFINYPTRIMFKSSKVVPTMLFSVLYTGRRYSRAEYANVGLLTIGILFFTLGDVQGYPEFDYFGLFLILLGVAADSLTSNFEEKNFFHPQGSRPRSSMAEVVCYSSLFGFCISLVVMLFSGELAQAMPFVWTHREVLRNTVIFSSCNYITVVCIMGIIGHPQFGSTYAEIVKSVRKVLSILLSFIAFGNPWNAQHVYGAILFTVSIFWGMSLKQQQRKAKERRMSSAQLLQEVEDSSSSGASSSSAAGGKKRKT